MRGTIGPVRKLIKIALIALGIRAFLRWRKKRRAQAELDAAPPPTPTPTADDPAAELRQKLAASRVEDSDVDPVDTPEASVADRRAEVHDQGKAAIDEMTSSDEA